MIGRCQYNDDVEDTLQVLPSCLLEVYDRILSKMEQHLQETPRTLHRVRRVLEWLVAARRPLTLRELSHAVSLEPNHAEPSLGEIVNEDSLTEHCGQLIHVNQESKEAVLCHSSVREYLTWRGYTNLRKAHHHTDLGCLTYLLFDAFKDPCDGTTKPVAGKPARSLRSNLVRRRPLQRAARMRPSSRVAPRSTFFSPSRLFQVSGTRGWRCGSTVGQIEPPLPLVVHLLPTNTATCLTSVVSSRMGTKG